jgi:chromosome partitioning protein
MLTLYANFKGGTGKSTLVFNMAMWCQAQGNTVTVCDLDPQRTVTDVAMIRDEDGVAPALKVVHDLPQKGRARGEWLIDVGASDMDGLRAAIRACAKIVIPVTPSQADIWATQQFLDIVKTERAKGKRPTILAFVNRADPHPKSRENSETLEALQSLGLVTPLPEKMVQRLAFRRSFSEGLAVFEMEPSGKAALELDALARVIHGSN